MSGICGYAPLVVSRKKKRGQNGQELVFVGYTCALVMRPCEGVDVCASISVSGCHVRQLISLQPGAVFDVVCDSSMSPMIVLVRDGKRRFFFFKKCVASSECGIKNWNAAGPCL